ncbi:hypothetical protein B296_00013367 [Ensete ventricosum]|uniref:Uncharacterized protein n=1 Tax=Ensete ventricosum TaxID=4639 RepID=A0A426XS92_ENSVE|nr:hypothetical protein B296_00013367 [Ensete ventricosum]
MTLEEAIDAELEAFENRMEVKMRSLFAEFSIGRPSSPRKSHHGETSDRRDDLQEHGHITSCPDNPCMKVDFPRWEEGDPIKWNSCAERYFRFYQTIDATPVEITAIHLEGDAIKCHEHRCKKPRLLMIEPVEDEDNEPYEEGLKPEEEATEEEPQPADYAVYALVGYSNPQTTKVGGLLK